MLYRCHIIHVHVDLFCIFMSSLNDFVHDSYMSMYSQFMELTNLTTRTCSLRLRKILNNRFGNVVIFNTRILSLLHGNISCSRIWTQISLQHFQIAQYIYMYTCTSLLPLKNWAGCLRYCKYKL